MSAINEIEKDEWDKAFYKWNNRINPPLCPPSVHFKQVGGDHYKDLKIQPIEYIQANDLGYEQGNVVKYITRYKNKNGVEDLLKAIHYIELLVEKEK